MTDFDPSQHRVLQLDPENHARVLGAPGSGKTAVLVEAYRRALERPGWSEADVLAIAPNRLVASELRARIERSAGRALGGTPVRTAASLGFAVLAREHALAGRAAPRLLTGTVQDEIVAGEIERLGEGHVGAGVEAELGALPPQVWESPAFRAELRDLWRVLDDYDLSPRAFAADLQRVAAAEGSAVFSRGPEPELLDRWLVAARLLDATERRANAERPEELSSSALLRAARGAIRRHGVRSDLSFGSREPSVETGFPVPRLILIDDAQELGEGALALLAACAEIGSSIWAFGDPDLATGAFQGERAGILAGLVPAIGRRTDAEAVRRAARARDSRAEQLVTLEFVHRHGAELRGFVRELSGRVGAAGAGAQRRAEAWGAGAGREAPSMEPDPAVGRDGAIDQAIVFARASSPAEQLGVIAHRLRARHLGIDGGEVVPWGEMAVLCRSRGEAVRAARALAVHQVPTEVAAGGVVLREHRIVRELIRLLQHALEIEELSATDVLDIAGGVIGGLDPIAVRRLRGSLVLQERRDAAAEEREPEGIDALVLEAFAFPGAVPVIDSAGGRALRRLGLVAQAARRVREAGGTAREALWAVWDGTRLAAGWQEEALSGRGARSDEANRSLDAVMGLFYALQRHEEVDSAQPMAELLEDLLESAVPEDTLARRSQRAAVTVTTPQGAIGQEFALVAVIGVQDGAWPNLRSRGSLLGTAALERWLRGGEAIAPSRRDTLHDELRLFVHACARARRELLVVAVSDDDQYPSAFFGLGRDHERTGLPSSRLTLRGQVAAMRRRVVAGVAADEDDAVALATLATLAAAEVPGAHPDDWYGVLPTSTDAPLVDLDGDADARVSVSPSQLERAENCPLDWVASTLGGGASTVQASLGTLLHHAFETSSSADPDELLAIVQEEWDKLPFAAPWEAERTERLARAMTSGLAEYLREFAHSDRELIGTESAFRVEIGPAVLRGVADRLERRVTNDGEEEITVLDLKTGRTPPSAAAAESHVQLQAYQLGVVLGAFERDDDANGDTAPQPEGEDSGVGAARSGGARLLYVHPDAAKQRNFLERAQQPISDEARKELTQRVVEAARVMGGGHFTARVEHHCSDPHQPGNCRLHIIPAVSRA
ncbi:PD-(D/E)XK nuclease family protein [Leucobacter sp. USHLN153]|uniref:PD-(D/E)XK nuclease family protein n=1 Tax=Leucobacter sp. USHLN153 TaxID=3081268 RepID=UPI0030167A25